MEENKEYELYWVCYIGYHNGKQITGCVQFKKFPYNKLNPNEILKILKRDIPDYDPRLVLSWSKLDTPIADETVEQG